MQVKVIINCDNAAFDDGFCEIEIGRILSKLGEACLGNHYGIESGVVMRVPLRDLNENTVGFMEAKGE